MSRRSRSLPTTPGPGRPQGGLLGSPTPRVARGQPPAVRAPTSRAPGRPPPGPDAASSPARAADDRRHPLGRGWTRQGDPLRVRSATARAEARQVLRGEVPATSRFRSHTSDHLRLPGVSYRDRRSVAAVSQRYRASPNRGASVRTRRRAARAKARARDRQTSGSARADTSPAGRGPGRSGSRRANGRARRTR